MKDEKERLEDQKRADGMKYYSFANAIRNFNEKYAEGRDLGMLQTESEAVCHYLNTYPKPAIGMRNRLRNLTKRIRGMEGETTEYIMTRHPTMKELEAIAHGLSNAKMIAAYKVDFYYNNLVSFEYYQDPDGYAMNIDNARGIRNCIEFVVGEATFRDVQNELERLRMLPDKPYALNEPINVLSMVPTR